jgi:hypothetical protein
MRRRWIEHEKKAKGFGQSGITILLQTFDPPLTTCFPPPDRLAA